MSANAMTIDVEDFFQVEAFARTVPRSAWDGFTRRVEANTDGILAQMDAAGARGTFFTLGWIAERHPALVRRIVAAGHELASHGHMHARVDTLSPEDFAEDIRRAKGVLEEIGGVAVRGYRAPTFSIGPRTPWAAEMLLREGYVYSSSVYPVRHDLYGDPDAPRTPFQPHGTALWELPMTTAQIGGRNIPCSGGGWFRLMPYPAFRLGLRQANREGRAGIFYTHPWEFDPGQPRVDGLGRLSRFRHYVNLHRTAPKFAALLADFRWDRMDRVFPFLAEPAPALAA